MKLDLQAVKESQNSDSVVRGGDADVHLQKERLAASQKECSCILPYLFLAGSSVAQNLELLQDSRITHIINFVGFVCPELFPENFIYRTLWLQDSGSEDILCILYDVFDLIEIVRELRGCRVLLHCCQGVSRSASLTIAYLMWRKNQSFEDAFHEVKSRRQVVNPNMGFVSQLMHWQRRISLPSERDALQIYRVAPHSPYDPLYLVPKVEGPGGIELLDTRGAFVIRYMNMLYIWKGQECHKEMLSVADNAAFQLVRYERAQGPCVLVREGKEKADISNVWSELLTLSRSMSRSVGGRVARYDADYEMYTNTKMGVYTPPRLESGILINLQPKEENWIPVQDSCSSNSQR
ncbi:hypothetical protein KP509_35G006800 [Ceratopteris richardii]|nr:hypothetical protein KP509_35G006800 [Ceratopteris richardii]